VSATSPTLSGVAGIEALAEGAGALADPVAERTVDERALTLADDEAEPVELESQPAMNAAARNTA
jgi:hypothetical protein